MKRQHQIIISVCASSILAISTFAQSTPIPRTDSPGYTRERAPNVQRADRLNGAAKASELIGMDVKNSQDEQLAKVEDLALDVESGRIVQVILSTGGFIGIGETLTAVPPGALHHDVARKFLHLDADKEKLKSAPKFENSKWAEYSSTNHLSQVYRHYGQEAAYTFVQSGDTAADRRSSTGTAPNLVSNRNAGGSWENDRTDGKSQFMIPTSRLGQVQKASKLIGTSVKNLQDENLGKVEDMLLDMASGRIVAAIISSGGFLGMRDELSAVPPSALRFTADRDSLQLDASKEMLGNAPHFKASQWPDFNEPGYTRGIYRAYNIEPYFTAAGPADADNTRRNVRDRDNRAVGAREPDNTGRNVRDRNDATLTPLDQGNSKSDVDTTARIRKEIIAVENLSVNARNVKIITVEGRVTLRGPVNTTEEKGIIGAIADRIATAGNVDNQLEVKSSNGAN